MRCLTRHIHLPYPAQRLSESMQSNGWSLACLGRFLLLGCLFNLLFILLWSLIFEFLILKRLFILISSVGVKKKSSNRIAPLLSKIAHSCGQREEAWENTAQTPGIIILENESMGTDENIATGLSLPTVHSSLSSLYIDKERFWKKNHCYKLFSMHLSCLVKKEKVTR